MRNAPKGGFAPSAENRQAQESLNRGVEFVSEPIKTFAERLRSQPGRFLDESEIDEFVIHAVPLFVGEGVARVEARRCAVSLKWVSSHDYPDGVGRRHHAI